LEEAVRSALTAVVMGLVALGVGAAAAEIIRMLRRIRGARALKLDARSRRVRASDIDVWLMVNFRYPGRVFVSRLRFIPKEEPSNELIEARKKSFR
jgi:hypothetical protein